VNDTIVAFTPKSQPRFKRGDKVVLISGGPPMTVQKVSGQDNTCRWFCLLDDSFDVDVFHDDELEAVPCAPQSS
jgi:uncharacterized protein YodC (DUF2158 family)